MTDQNNSEIQQLRVQVGRDRLAKLRALGREMELRARVDALRQESASKEQHYLRELENAKVQREEITAQRDAITAQRDAISAQMEVERQEAAERERELKVQLENSRLQLQMVLNSRSWKITQPLRDVTSWIEGRRRQDAAPLVEAPPPMAESALDSTAETQTPESTADLESVIPAAPETEVTESVASEQASPVTPEPQSPQVSKDSFVTSGKDAWDEAGSQRLQEFLSSDQHLSFPHPAQPTVSIIIALYNKAHLGLLCFESILLHAGSDYELILVDNASSDATSQLLDRLDGAKIIRNAENTGFGHACTQGAQNAAGKYLCFLNNDLMLCPGSLEAAVADLETDERCGAVGGKLLLSDGRLQEAGSMVWSDGTAWGYGREDDPASPKYAFRRPTDYCSGALLLTPRALFNELGGFDETFSPAYYEDTDYCFKVWGRGLKVIYEPLAVVHHYESASMQTAEAAKALIASHRTKFVKRWADRLAKQLPLSGAAIPYARIAVQAGGARLIYMSSRVPHRELGPDFARANGFICELAAQGHSITCVSMSQPLQSDEYSDIPREVELADAKAHTHYVFRELLSQYEAVWIAGHESMREFLWHLWDMDERIPPIIYEPGVIAGTGADSSLHSPEMTDEQETASFEEEVTLCQAADIVLVQSKEERELLLHNRVARVEVFSEKMTDRILAEVARQGPRS